MGYGPQSPLRDAIALNYTQRDHTDHSNLDFGAVKKKGVPRLFSGFVGDEPLHNITQFFVGIFFQKPSNKDVVMNQPRVRGK